MQFLKINLTEIIINYKNFTNFWGFLKHFLNKCKTIDKFCKTIFINDDQKMFCKTKMRIVNEILLKIIEKLKKNKFFKKILNLE